MGSYPTFDPSVLAKPITQAHYDATASAEGRLAAGQPRDRRRLSDGLDVQADHRARRARERHHHPETPIDDHGCMKIGAASTSAATPARPSTGRSTCAARCRSPPTSTSTRSACDANAAPGPGHPDLGAQAGARQDRRASTSRGEAGGTIPDRAWRERVSTARSSPTRSQAPQRLPAELRLLGQARVDHGRQRPASRSARATCRPRRCRWPSPTRRWRTAARSSGRISGCRSRTTPAASCSASTSRRGARSKIDPTDRQADPRRPARGDDGRRHLGPRLLRLEPAGAPDLRQDGHRRAPAARPTSRGTPRSCRDPTKPIVIVATIEDGGFGADAAAPVTCRMLAHWFDQKAACAAGAVEDPMSTTRGAIQPGETIAVPRSGGLHAAVRPVLALRRDRARHLLAARRFTRRAPTTSPATRTTTSRARRSTSPSARSWRSSCGGWTTRACAS